MTIYEFMSDSPWLTFFIMALICEMLLKIVSRTLRCLNIYKSGWPPEHLDADGDFKKELD